MENKNYTWVAFAVIVIVVGAIFLSGNKAEAPTTTETATQNTGTSPITTESQSNAPVKEHGVVTPGVVIPPASVSYTDGGFQPSAVEIKAGQKVQFVNVSSGGMWIASNPHPQHTLYLEFDEKGVVPRGGIYTFIFSRAGTWHYHNHINPSQTGTVIVK